MQGDQKKESCKLGGGSGGFLWALVRWVRWAWCFTCSSGFVHAWLILESLRGGWRGVARGRPGGWGMAEVASCWWSWGRGWGEVVSSALPGLPSLGARSCPVAPLAAQEAFVAALGRWRTKGFHACAEGGWRIEWPGATKRIVAGFVRGLEATG